VPLSNMYNLQLLLKSFYLNRKYNHIFFPNNNIKCITLSKTKSAAFSTRSIVLIGNPIKLLINSSIFSGVILFKIDVIFLFISCWHKYKRRSFSSNAYWNNFILTCTRMFQYNILYTTIISYKMYTGILLVQYLFQATFTTRFYLAAEIVENMINIILCIILAIKHTEIWKWFSDFDPIWFHNI